MSKTVYLPLLSYNSKKKMVIQSLYYLYHRYMSWTFGTILPFADLSPGLPPLSIKDDQDASLYTWNVLKVSIWGIYQLFHINSGHFFGFERPRLPCSDTLHCVEQGK